MARNTRQKRAQKRRERTKRPTASSRRSPRARARVNGKYGPRRRPSSRRPAHAVSPAAAREFIGESTAELKKVEWPNRAQVMQGTIVVIIACAIVGAYLCSRLRVRAVGQEPPAGD